MGGSQSTFKEELVLAQNAAGGGANSAHIEQLKYHVGITTYILMAICLILAVGALIVIYKMYKRYHENLIQRQLNEITLKRYASLLRHRHAKGEETV